MTYLQLYETLKRELKEKVDTYLKMENELCQDKGWADLGDLRDYNMAKEEWQAASDNYRNVIFFIKKNAIKLDDEVCFISPK